MCAFVRWEEGENVTIPVVGPRITVGMLPADCCRGQNATGSGLRRWQVRCLMGPCPRARCRCLPWCLQAWDQDGAQAQAAVELWQVAAAVFLRSAQRAHAPRTRLPRLRQLLALTHVPRAGGQVVL